MAERESVALTYKEPVALTDNVPAQVTKHIRISIGYNSNVKSDGNLLYLSATDASDEKAGPIKRIGEDAFMLDVHQKFVSMLKHAGVDGDTYEQRFAQGVEEAVKYLTAAPTQNKP